MLFLHAPWSVYSIRSRRVVTDFEASTINNAYIVGLNMTCWEFVVDDDERLDGAISRWLDRQRLDSALFLSSGGGGVVWTVSGMSVDSIGSAEWLPSLLDRTREAFQ